MAAERDKALADLATACGGMVISLGPDPVAMVRLVAAKNACLGAGMTVREVNEAIDDFRDAARKAARW